MDFRKVRHLAFVLIASQLRAGRSTSDPKAFTGRPIVIVVLDIAVLAVVFLFGVLILGAIRTVDASFLAVASTQALPFLPLFVLGGVILAGVMFELGGSGKFAGSDAVNWLPLTTEEYVLGSSLSIAFSDSVILAFTSALALAFAVVSGAYAADVLAAGLCAVALFEGSLLVEILRAGTQRASAAFSGRAGRFSILLRAVLFIAVIVSFQLVFNPVLLVTLLGALHVVAAVSAYVPFLWASFAVTEAQGGAFAVAVLFAALQVGLVGAFGYIAIRVRGRFWAPTPVEIRLEAHAYYTPHPFLAALGLSRAEAAIVTKDLKGLVRRRELLPVIVLPVVAAVVLILDTSINANNGATFGGEGAGLYASWFAGFAALILAASSFGQERRAVQHLYSSPIPPASVYRAKLAFALLIGSVIGAALSLVVGLVGQLQAWAIVAVVGAGLLVVASATFLGLAFASRYSDFQERPRPQFLRPAPMLAATATAALVDLLIAAPIIVLIFSVGSPFAWTLLLVSAGIAAVVLVVTSTLARRGTLRLMREVPI